MSYISQHFYILTDAFNLVGFRKVLLMSAWGWNFEDIAGECYQFIKQLNLSSVGLCMNANVLKQSQDYFTIINSCLFFFHDTHGCTTPSPCVLQTAVFVEKHFKSLTLWCRHRLPESTKVKTRCSTLNLKHGLVLQLCNFGQSFWLYWQAEAADLAPL